MKHILSLCLALVVSLFLATVKAQQPAVNDSTVSFKVFGNCEMCKDRIEKAAKIKGVKSASWDADTRMLSLLFQPSVASLAKVHARVAAAGHDTELEKAKDATYKNLPGCCQYRETEAAPAHDHTPEQAPAPAAAGTPAYHIKGVVLEENNKGTFRPLEGASVVWLGSGKGTSSDKDGVFQIAHEGGDGRLVISFAGFRPDTVEVADRHELKVILASGKVLQEVKVLSKQATAYLNAYSPFHTAVMSQKELFKAACCNLSESFETNPSVDVSYSDAVTGSKQIQLLGLSGIYTQLTVENLPGPRGLATAQGLNSIAGPWVESIQLTKGVGSVVNGYESIAGQINVELKKPATAEQLHVNGYANSMGKADLNLVSTHHLGAKWATTFLLHDAYLKMKPDFNNDGFLDLPTGNLFSGSNRWQYAGTNGLTSQFGFKVLLDNKVGGMMDFNPDQHRLSDHHYGLGFDTRRYEGFGKIGYVFPRKKYKSIGLQLSAFDHNQESYFGQTVYNAQQQNFYSNLIYQSIIGTDAHKFKTGLSFVYDRYNEALSATDYRRTEVVPGAFFEYTYSPVQKLTLVAGLRGDHNSLFGFFATPRLNLRYQFLENTTLRVGMGRGQRTANIFAENSGVLVSARRVNILPSGMDKAYGLNPEVSWNKGISIDQRFKLLGRNATLVLDYYRNDFSDQVVVDLEDPRQVKFYNLEGKSYSNSFQAELNATPLEHFDVRLAYRLFDVKTTYSGELLQKALTARNRAFANLAYDLKGWKFDYTINYIGPKRIPSTAANPEAYRMVSQSPSYVLMNAQVSKTLGKQKRFDAYIGGENLTNYLQKNSIIAAGDPFGPYFDASLVWGPVAGRQVYAGFRYTLK
ncbi:TonB-dependent receptor [Paraflavisolibacter sp. H34]|uniref:TonB-dependent receptor domain-containing protein n=1 Tax=Huijunlia imazamoxiresistens TaxID=3127457 RepID=UPI0030190438